jgi:hypothetical protein
VPLRTVQQTTGPEAIRAFLQIEQHLAQLINESAGETVPVSDVRMAMRMAQAQHEMAAQGLFDFERT